MSKLEFESIEECSKFLEGETFIYNDAECVVLSDAEKCYVLGYKKAIDKACEYINNHWNKLLVYEYNQFGGSVFNRKKTVEQFRKALED